MASFDLDEDPDQINSESAVKDSRVHVARFFDDSEEKKSICTSPKASKHHEMADFVGSSIPLKVDLETAGLLKSQIRRRRDHV